MNIGCVDLIFINTVLVVHIMTVSSEDELEMAGLVTLRKPLSCDLLRESQVQGVCGGRSREEHLLIFAFVSERCILSVDAGTRMHLLDAKGLSFIQKVSSVFITVYNIFAFGGQHSEI